MSESSNPSWGVSIGGVDFSKFVREVDIDWDVTKVTLRTDEREPTLPEWWAEQTEMDIERTVPKIEEYGTRDLEAMGHALATARGTTFTPAQAAIYGCMFYALGKTMRAIASLERGDTPSEDTLFDLSVYAMMARSYEDRGKL